MLHLALAANLLNAVGGRPRLDTPKLLSPYPRPFPHGDRSFEVPLKRFCPETLDVFLRMERPALPGAPPESADYETISQFYDAIEQGVIELCTKLGEASVFCGDPIRQLTEQGEGASDSEVWDGDRDVFHPEREQVAHYYRFQELKLGRRYCRGDSPQSGPTGDAISIDWDGVRPMRSNPRTADHAPGSPIRTAQEAFNRAYCEILRLLDQAFDGRPQTLGHAIGAMFDLKARAQALMQMPTGVGLTTAGPTFEYMTNGEP
jgi:hypothetical protein